MTRFISVHLLLFVFLLTATNVFGDPYTIGVPIPLTGANRTAGQEIQRGFELGKEILGLRDTHFVFEDDACDGVKSVTAIKKLIEIDKVDVISGIYCNNALLPAAQLLNRAKIPVLTVGATTGDQTGIGPRIFRITPADQLSLNFLFPEMVKRGKRLCLITETDAYSALIERTILREWPKQSDGALVLSESANAGERDFRAALARLMRRGCDSIFINACGEDGFIAAFKQLKTVRGQEPVFTLYNPGSSTVQEALGETLRGVVYADLVSSAAITTPLGSEFLKRYRERYGDFLLAQPIALLAFEALRVINEAHAQGVPLDEFLRRGPIRNGAISQYSFDADGAVQGVDFQVWTY